MGSNLCNIIITSLSPLYYYRIFTDILKLAEHESEIQVLCWFVFCEIMHSIGSVLHIK